MKHLKIAHKIILAFATVFALLLLIASTAVSTTARTGNNVNKGDLYSGLQNRTNELMHILNETRISAGVFYETHAPGAYEDVSRQLMYCDLRLQMLYEYLDQYHQAVVFREKITEYEILYTRWRDGLHELEAGYDLNAPLSEPDQQEFRRQADELRKINLLAHEQLSNTINDMEDAYTRMTAQTRDFNLEALVIVIAVSVISLFVTAYLALMILRSITTPVKYMRDVMSQISKTGNLSLSEETHHTLNKIVGHRDEISHCTEALLGLLERLHAIDHTVTGVADGDLTMTVSLRSPQDTMGLAVREMLRNLNQKFGAIALSAMRVEENVKELSDGSRQLFAGSYKQSDSVRNLSASVQRVNQKAEQNSSLANQASLLVNDIQQNALKGRLKMNQMIRAAQDIDQASQAIREVIKVIEDIAFQTNILALNASVEAARVGVNGRGFAVVANEVHNLALKSAEAAKDTGKLIENTIQKAALGTAIARETSLSLEDIVGGVVQSNAVISDISALSQEQVADIRGIITDMSHVETIVKQNSMIAARSADAAEGILEQANMLTRLVKQFRLLEQREECQL